MFADADVPIQLERDPRTRLADEEGARGLGAGRLLKYVKPVPDFHTTIEAKLPSTGEKVRFRMDGDLNNGYSSKTKFFVTESDAKGKLGTERPMNKAEQVSLLAGLQAHMRAGANRSKDGHTYRMVVDRLAQETMLRR